MTGQFFALITAICWAQNSVSYSISGMRVGSQTVTHIRLWIALPAILVVNYFFTGSFIPEIAPDRYFFTLFSSGFIGYFIADTFIFYSFVALGPGRTLLILTLSPVLSAVISFFVLGESLKAVQAAGMLVTISGILMVIYNENRIEKIDNNAFKGIIFAVIGAVAQAAGMVLSKLGMTGGIHPVSANTIRIAAGFTGLVLFALVRRELVSDFKKMKDVKALLRISVAALLGPVIGIVLTLYALQLAPVGIITTITQISPVLLLPYEAIVMKRKLSPSILAGTLIAVAGAVLLFMF